MKVFIAIVILCILTEVSFSQGKYDANWCFGVNAGINFNDTANPLNFYTFCNNYDAAATVSDSSGNLLYYIAPDTPFIYYNIKGSYYSIFNANKKPIINGSGIYAGATLTNSIFLTKPTSGNEYYLFYMQLIDTDFIDTNEQPIFWEFDRLYYALVRNDSLISNQLLYDGPLEWRMAATKHANGSDWWLFVHASNKGIDTISTDLNISFLIQADTILGPFYQNIGYEHDESEYGEMSFSPNGNYLASALDAEWQGELFNFNRCTGILSNYIDLPVSSQGDIYGCEFSEDGNKLYFTETDPGNGYAFTSTLFQYLLDSPNIIQGKQIVWVDSIASNPLFNIGQLRRAPNYKIYMSVVGSTDVPYDSNYYSVYNEYLWVINTPDSTGKACSFQPLGYFLGDSARTYFGLPNMANYNLDALSIYQAGAGTDTTICTTDSITIGLSPVAGVTYQWQGVGITNANLAQPTVSPDSSTWYYVTLTDTTIQYSCQSRTDSIYVQVVHCCDSALLAQCTLSKDTFICTNIDTPTKGAVLSVDTVPGVSFVWQSATGISVRSTQQIVDPSQSTWYYVTFYSDTDSDSSSACNQRKDSVYVEVKKCMVGIDEISLVTQHLNIYPNPAQNIVTIEWSSNGASDANIVVYDVLGREVKKASLSGAFGMAQIDVSDLANGLYVVRVLSSSGGGVGGGKLTVIK